eukprot:9362998-Pyramimonas_sp.AAC.1
MRPKSSFGVRGPMGKFREFHRRPLWQGSSRGPFRHTPHTVRGPSGSSTEGPSDRVRMRPQVHFGRQTGWVWRPFGLQRL